MDRELTEGQAAPRLMRETWLYLPSVLVPALSGLVTIVVLTRLMSPSGFGFYSLAMAAGLAVSTVVGEWLTATTIRFYNDDYTDTDTLRDHLGRLVLWSCAGAAVVAVPLLFAVAPATFVIPATALAVVHVARKAAVGIVRAQLMTTLFSAVTAVTAVASTALGIALFVFTDWAPSILWANVAAGVVAVVVLARRGGWHRRQHVRVPIDDLKPLFRFGLPMILTAAGSQVLLLADRYIIGVFASATEVGIYVPNYALPDRLIGFVFAPLFAALYPLAAKAWSVGDQDGALSYLRKAQRGFLLVGGLACALLALHAETVSRVAVGSEFASGSRVIGIVAVATLFWYQGILFHQPLELDKRTGLIMGQVLVAGAVSIALNVVLVPAFGIDGAAWATLGAYGFYMVSSYAFSRRLVTKSLGVPWDSLVRVLAFIGLMALVRDRLGLAGWWGIVALAPLYTAFMFVTREPGLSTLVETVRGRSRPRTESGEG